jgi:cyclopropane fatty-acyl-phospholipid synthase-like methyltransferase
MISCGFVNLGKAAMGESSIFGCGVGRLSKASCSYFEEVYGVDNSEEMIRLARKRTTSCKA